MRAYKYDPGKSRSRRLPGIPGVFCWAFSTTKRIKQTAQTTQIQNSTSKASLWIRHHTFSQISLVSLPFRSFLEDTWDHLYFSGVWKVPKVSKRKQSHIVMFGSFGCLVWLKHVRIVYRCRNTVIYRGTQDRQTAACTLSKTIKAEMAKQNLRKGPKPFAISCFWPKKRS